jgi:hypothetical protein
MTQSAKQFRSYQILKIDFAAEFCFWTEQWLNGTQLLGLGLAETLELSNTNTVANSLSFFMVCITAPNGRGFMSYNCRKLNRFVESGILGRLHLSAQVRILTKFHHDLPRNIKYQRCR